MKCRSREDLKDSLRFESVKSKFFSDFAFGWNDSNAVTWLAEFFYPNSITPLLTKIRSPGKKYSGVSPI